MYVKDHPPPHVRAVYDEHGAFVSIDTGEVLQGSLPKAYGAIGPRLGPREATAIARKLAAGLAR
jgi:hypothetical protein